MSSCCGEAGQDRASAASAASAVTHSCKAEWDRMCFDSFLCVPEHARGKADVNDKGLQVNIGNFVPIKEFLWRKQVKCLTHGSVAACALVECTGASVKNCRFPGLHPRGVSSSRCRLGPGICILSGSLGDSEMHSEKLWVNPSPAPAATPSHPPGTSGDDDIFWGRH